MSPRLALNYDHSTSWGLGWQADTMMPGWILDFLISDSHPVKFMRVVTGLRDFMSQAFLEVRVQSVARYSKAQSVSVHTHVFCYRNLRFSYICAYVYAYIFRQSFFTDQQVPHWLPAHIINFLKRPLRQFSDEAILTQDGCHFDSFGFLQMAISHACLGGAGVVWKEGPGRVSGNWVSSIFLSRVSLTTSLHEPFYVWRFSYNRGKKIDQLHSVPWGEPVFHMKHVQNENSQSNQTLVPLVPMFLPRNLLRNSS